MEWSFILVNTRSKVFNSKAHCVKTILKMSISKAFKNICPKGCTKIAHKSSKKLPKKSTKELQKNRPKNPKTIPKKKSSKKSPKKIIPKIAKYHQVNKFHKVHEVLQKLSDLAISNVIEAMIRNHILF